MARRRRALVTAVVLSGGIALAAVGATASAASHAAPSFATPVVVDQWRPGFEPDVAADFHQHNGNRLYTTWPNGFSTTQSFMYRSEDHGRSFHPTEGNVAGKTLTCAGGGDSEIQVNPADGALYFADLQGLTNFSNSTSSDGGRTFSTSCTAVPGVGVDRQWIALDTNGGKSSIGSGAADGRAYFTYDNILQNTETRDTTSGIGGNQLVMNQSQDGVTYGGSCPAPTLCVPPAIISGDEGLPGNTLVDNTPGGPFQHTVYVMHTNGAGTGVILSFCRGPATGPRTAATVADACTDPANFDSSDPGHVNVLWHDVAVRPADPKVVVEAFTAMAIDTAGNLYTTWAEYPFNSGDGVFTGTGRVMFSRSTDGGAHWSTPTRISPTSLKTPVQPWIAAGDPGRINLAYYAAPQGKEAGAYGPDNLTKTGTWNVYLDQSLNALGAATFAHMKVSDHQVKWGNVSTQGLGGSTDRSLGDYMQVQTGVHGEALVSYVDDTSENRNPDFTFGSGQSPPEAAGPTMIAVQTGGPSLFKSIGTIHGDAQRPYGKASDPTGKGYPDSYFSQLGTATDGTAALDVAGVTITQADSRHLRIQLKTADPSLSNDLAVSPTLGGSTADWIVRWAAPSYGKRNSNGYLGDGDIFYVGMESTGGGTPKFFTGSTDSLTTTHAKYFVYTPKSDVPGAIKGSTVTWTVPLSAVGSPPKGGGLFSVTAFTSTQLLPSTPSLSLPNGGVLAAYTPPNLIDQSLPVTYTIGKLTPGVPGSLRSPGNNRSLATTGLPFYVPLAALLLVTGAAIVVRRRGHASDHEATR